MSGGGLNGKTGEVLRWFFGMFVAAIVAYYSAQLTIENRVTAVETKQDSNFQELLRAVNRIESDVREIRKKGSE